MHILVYNFLYLGESKGGKIFPEKNNFYNRVTGCSGCPERRKKLFFLIFAKMLFMEG